MLSNITLNITVPKVVRKYRRNYTHKPRFYRIKTYSLLLPSYTQWYPLAYASYQFDNRRWDFDAEWLRDLFPKHFHASLWINNRNKRYTLRIARDRLEAGKRVLMRHGFIFNTKIYAWKLPYRKEKRLMAKFGGQGGKIDYADMGKKRDNGSMSGTDLSRKGSGRQAHGIGTTDTGSGYEGTVKDTKFREVADASGW